MGELLVWLFSLFLTLLLLLLVGYQECMSPHRGGALTQQLGWSMVMYVSLACNLVNLTMVYGVMKARICIMAFPDFKIFSLQKAEFNYITPYDSAACINSVVMPEFFVQGVQLLLFLLTGHWLMLMFCAPYLYYNLRRYRQRQYLINVVEIFNILNWEETQRFMKLAYLFVLLFVSIFWTITVALDDQFQQL